MNTQNKNTALSPIIINKTRFPTRIFLAPINTGFSNSGKPNANFFSFFSNRSGNYIGATYIGNISIGKEYCTNANTIYISDEKHLFPGAVEIANKITEKGSVPAIQLACRASSIQPLRPWTNPNTADYISTTSTEISSLTEGDIRSILDRFIISAIASYKCGFKIIQIHAAHGYFLSRLLNRTLNKRTDRFKYSSPFFIEYISSEIKRKIPDVVLDIRINLLDGLNDKEEEISYKREIFDRLPSLGIDVISISNGLYDITKPLIYPDLTLGHGPYIDTVLMLSTAHPAATWNVAGNIWDINNLPTGNENVTYSLCRQLIADHLTIQKTALNKTSEIIMCTRCNECHYYSNSSPHLNCPISSDLSTKSNEDI